MKPEEAEDAQDAQGKRQRGTISFPYADLNDAIKVTQVAWQAGGSRAQLDQIAAGTGHRNIQSGGFRIKVGAARLFGLARTSGLDVTLTPLGTRIVDPRQAELARVEAFLHVPLFRTLFNRHRGGLLPGPAGLEQEMLELGIAPKQRERARQVFQRSAEQAGFFRAGPDRLVMPATGEQLQDEVIERHDDETPPDDGERRKTLRDHPLVQGLFEMLPSDAPWSEQELQQWLNAAALNFRLVYRISRTDPNEPEQLSGQSPTGAQALDA